MIDFGDTLNVFVADDKYLIGASFADGQVAVVDSLRRTLVAHVRLPASCGYAYAVSNDRRYLAVGYQYARLSSIQLWDLGSGNITAEIPKSYPSILEFDPSGRYIVYEAVYGRAGTYVYDLLAGNTESVSGAQGPPSIAFTQSGLIMPRVKSARTGEQRGLRVRFDPLAITEISLPTKKPVWLLSASPSENTFLILDAGATISNVDAASGKLIWKQRVSEAGWLSYSGDGRFVAVLECDASHGGAKRLVVLDGSSGKVVRFIEHAERASAPLAGPKALCLSGRFVNLETGEVESGVSDVDWWRSLLTQ